MAYEGKNPVKESLIFNNKAAAGVPNAPTGKVRILQRDGTLFSQDDAGLESELGAGSGGGINYFQNPKFETSITDGVTTGGTATTNTAETAAPLFDAQSLRISSGAGVSTNDFAIVDIDPAVIEAQILTQVTAYLKTDSAVAEGDWTVGVYNTTDAVYATEQTDLKVDVINIHRSPFVPLTGKTYVLRVEFTDTTAGRILIVDQLENTPDSNAALVPFEQRTVEVDNSVLAITGSTSLTVDLASVRCLKDANGKFRLNGNITFTPTASHVANGYSLTLTGVTFSADADQAVSMRDSNITTRTSDQFAAARAQLNASTIQINTSSSFEYNAGPWLLSLDVLLKEEPTWFASNLDDNKVNLLTQNVVQANIRGTWTLTSTAYTGNTVMDFDTEVTAETIGTWPNTNGTIIIPADGTYEVNAAASADWSASAALSLYVNTVNTRLLGQGAGTNNSPVSKGSCYITLSKDDTVSVRNNNGATLSATASITYLQITRVADFGAFDPIGFAVNTPAVYGLGLQPQVLIKSNSTDYSASANVVLLVSNVPVGTYRVTMGANAMVCIANEDCFIRPDLNGSVITQNGSSQWVLGTSSSGSDLLRPFGWSTTQILDFPNAANTFSLDIVLDASSEINKPWYILERLNNDAVITTEWD